MGKYRKYNNGGSFLDTLDEISQGVVPDGANPASAAATGGQAGGFLRSLAGSGKLGDFLKSDLAKSLGALGVGAFERGRAKRALEAGIDAREDAAKKQSAAGKKAYEKMLSKLRDRPAVTQASEDAFQGQKEAAEALLAAGDRRTQEQRGDIVSALQSGDPRAAASMLGTLEKLDAGDDARRAQALGMKTAADQKRAGMVEREKDFQSSLDQLLMDRGAQAADEGRRELLDLTERREAAGPAATSSGMQTATALATLLKDFKPGNPGDEERKYGGRIKAEAGMRYMADEGFKTEGEFNHATNKKAVIDEENGRKEAELTGGELVFNPKQTKKIENLIEDGKAKELLDFMKDLLAQPQFQD
tara:strand:+ start:1194 stop:2273 length:1080 start_codon:yes stop_codon:yes gene_type:complete